MQKHHKVLIIGAGPAGVSTAIYLKRAGVSVEIIERNRVGGLIINARRIDNYAGFPNGVTGTKFVQLLNMHIQRLELPVLYEDLLHLDYADDTFTARTNKSTHSADFVVVATGTKPKVPEIRGLYKIDADLWAYEPFFFQNIIDEKIAVIGAGDAAFDYALSLAERNSTVILNRSDRTRCLNILEIEALSHKNIEYKTNAPVSEVIEYNRILHFYDSQGVTICSANRLLIAIGRIADYGFLSDNIADKIVELNSQNRFFIIGDAQNGIFRQSSIAVGDGVRAAMSITAMLNKEIK